MCHALGAETNRLSKIRDAVGKPFEERLLSSLFQVLLNVALYAGMKLESVKNTVKFVANIAEAGPSSVMIKVKSDDASPLFEKMKEQLPPAEVQPGALLSH